MLILPTRYDILKYEVKSMDVTKAQLNEKFKAFKNSAEASKIPRWDALPDIELYMDQVIVLLNQYIGAYISTPVTQSMINNYVKLKAIPAPVKKRYSKVHLSYLLVFCTLKQTLSIATIQKIMPVDLSVEEVKKVYTSFLNNRQKSMEYTFSQVKKLSDDLDDSDDTQYCADIIMQISNITNVFKSLTENLLNDN